LFLLEEFAFKICLKRQILIINLL